MKRGRMIKLAACCVIVVLGVGCCSCSSALSKAPSVLMNTGQTLHVGGSGPGNYSRIQDAVDNASDGDMVFVYDDSAPYYENIAIRVSIHLIGENRNTTSIEGGNHAISIFADGVTVSGFRISNVGDFWNCCGFYVTSQGNNISHNNIINNLRMNGVFLDGASYNTIWDNLIENNNFHGIRLEFTSHNVIANNVIVNNRGYGIYLWESPENTLIGNTVKQNFFGGIVLGDNSGNNTIFHNNFIDNPENAHDATGNNWDNGLSGNYWSDYTGSDSDGDGIGDSPYSIPGNVSQDRYPLMAPYESQTPDVEITITNRVGLTISVKNKGTEDALDVDWNSRLSGGLLLLPSERANQGTLMFLAAGQELVIQKVTLLFGFGVIEVNVTVGKTSESLRGLLLLFVFVPLSS
jgi:parallel beta-helix repeat protein